MRTSQNLCQRVVRVACLAIIGTACGASADEIPGAFLCMSKCSERGFFNQLMISDNEFSIIASATPGPKITFAAGSYSIDGDVLSLSGENFSVAFQIERGQVNNYLGTFDAIWLKWISGTNDYFKEGMKFVEALPALYGKSSDCLKNHNRGTPECFGQPEDDNPKEAKTNGGKSQ